jgi:hypothetical protein
MATSGTYTYFPSIAIIINEAFSKINRKGDFETLTPGDNRYTQGLQTLNPLIKSNAAMGMPIWQIEELVIDCADLTSVNGVDIGVGATIAVAAPLKVIQAIRRYNYPNPPGFIDVSMEIYTHDYYNTLANKQSTGAPLGLFYQPLGPANSNYGRIKVWPLPSTEWVTNGEVIITYQRKVQDVGTTSTDNLDFPDYWQQALIYQLAYALAPNYGIDMNLRQALKSDMMEEVQKALSFMTEEGSISFQPRAQWG